MENGSLDLKLTKPMRIFIAKKIQEAVFDEEGILWLCVKIMVQVHLIAILPTRMLKSC